MWGAGRGCGGTRGNGSPWEESGNKANGKEAFVAHENVGTTTTHTGVYSLAFRIQSLDSRMGSVIQRRERPLKWGQQ